jgi:ATP-dependent protease HslVU (ClpYQ) ATPase subunit
MHVVVFCDFHIIPAEMCNTVVMDAQVRLLLLAALCQEHVLFIGPPGTAKSEVGRRLSKLVNGTYFERLLTRFSVPEVRHIVCPCLAESIDVVQKSHTSMKL